MRKYLADKYAWSNPTIDTIDWQVHGNALKRMQGRSQTTILKFIHGWLPVNGHQGTGKHGSAQLCPQCRALPETQTHFLECSDPTVVDAWKIAQTELEKKLTTTTADPILLKLLILAFTEWRTQDHPKIPPFITGAYIKLFQQQSKIGWTHVLQGRISTEWVRIHDQRAQHTKVKRNGVQWFSAAIGSIFEKLYCVWKCRCAAQHGIDHTT